MQIKKSTGQVCESKLYLVDLAGSERVKKSKVVGARRDEAIKINQSLMVLGKVIEALSTGKSHVPYHECRYTQNALFLFSSFFQTESSNHHLNPLCNIPRLWLLQVDATFEGGLWW